MKNKYIIFGLCAVLLGLFSSCDLERNPLDQYAADTFWTNEQNALIALAGIYRGNIPFNQEIYNVYDWWDYHGLVFMEHASDNAYDRRGANNAVFSILWNGKLSSASAGSTANYWLYSYRKIARCNKFLEGIEQIEADEATVARFKAEARFIRATQYFYMSCYFQEVPLITSSISMDEANVVTKSSQAELINFVITELTAAAKDLPRFKDLAAGDKGRACRQAALAFLGRMQLFDKRYSDAAATYKEIIDYGDNIIDPDYKSIFEPRNEGSAENIFSMQYMSTYAGSGYPQHAYPVLAGGWCLSNPTGDLFEAYQFTDGSDFSFESPLYDPTDLTKNRDPRLGMTIVTNGSTFGGKVYNSNPDSSSPDRTTTGSQTTRTGFVPRKYFDEDLTVGLTDYGGDLPIIRYAEVLLSYLEAKLEAGDAITQSLLDETINKVRGRANVNMPPITITDAQALRPVLRNERRVELALEGIRYWDLIRWHIAHEVLTGPFYGSPFPGSTKLNGSKDPYFRYLVGTRSFRNPDDYRWPIAQGQIDVNPNLGL